MFLLSQILQFHFIVAIVDIKGRAWLCKGPSCDDVLKLLLSAALVCALRRCHVKRSFSVWKQKLGTELSFCFKGWQDKWMPSLHLCCSPKSASTQILGHS